MLNWAGEKQHFTFKLGAYAPTGTFDADSALNTSRNYWTGEIGGAYTYFDPQTGFEASAEFRLSLQLGKPGNQLPFRRRGLSELDGCPALFEDFTAGVSGYVYSQIEPDEGDVVGLLDASDIHAQSYGLGPAVQWNVPVGETSVGVIGKALFDLDATDRLSGNLYMLSLTYAL